MLWVGDCTLTLQPVYKGGEIKWDTAKQQLHCLLNVLWPLDAAGPLIRNLLHSFANKIDGIYNNTFIIICDAVKKSIDGFFFSLSLPL